MGQGPGDLDELLLGDTQATHLHAWTDIEADLVQRRPRILLETSPVDANPSPHRQAAEEDVLRNRQIGDQFEFLVYDPDAGVGC